MKLRVKPELLAPAGDLEKCKVAILYGADAVFIGGKQFSLRAKASNFTIADIQEAVMFAHLHHSKIYVTVNMYPHPEDMEGLESYLLSLDEVGVDAIIVSSPHIIQTARKLQCRFELHLSTQQSTSNREAIHFWQDFGISRIVLARELSIEEIGTVKSISSVPIEVFVHGGLCSSFSGRCTLSNTMTLRDANRGGCAHSCRWFYDLYEDNHRLNDIDRPFRIGSKDLQALSLVPELMDLGVNSFKIEGRMKSLHYIATVVRVYRRLIDSYWANGVINPALLQELIQELGRAENRASSIGFLKGIVNQSGGLYQKENEQPPQDFIGVIKNYDITSKLATMEQRNAFDVGIEVEIFQPNAPTIYTTLKRIYDESGEEVQLARHAKSLLRFSFPEPLVPYAIVRRR